MLNLKAPRLTLGQSSQLAAAALAVLGLSCLLWATATPVRVLDGALAIPVRTHGGQVASALTEAGVVLAGADRAVPGPDAELGSRASVFIARERLVQLMIDGAQHNLLTSAANPANLVGELGIRLLPGDQVWVNGLTWKPGQSWALPISRIRLEHGEITTVRSAGQSMDVHTNGSSAVSAFRSAGLALFEADRANGGWLSPIETESARHVPSRAIVISADGSQVAGRTTATKVGAALAEVGLTPQGLDEVEPGLEASVLSADSVRIARVGEQLILELEPVPFETEYQPLADVELDEKRALDTGAYGVRANQVRVRTRDGEEFARIAEGSWLAREPEPRLIGYGTNIIIRSVSTEHGSIEYWRAVDMWATSYSPSRAGVSPDAPNFGITASGKPLRNGLVAIDRTLIPFGTMMYVPGYGFAEAADTGSGVKGLWIDLGYEDDDYVPWARTVTVYFLTPVPPANSIVWILP